MAAKELPPGCPQSQGPGAQPASCSMCPHGKAPPGFKSTYGYGEAADTRACQGNTSAWG